MKQAVLEHVNVTVSNPWKTADMLVELFGWKIRWEGKSGKGGDTIHVGTPECYLAVYSRGDGDTKDAPGSTAGFKGGLNHIAVQVDDLDLVEARVTAAGFTPHNHGDYEPGRRFYFNDGDDIEYEVVSYADPA